MSRQQPVVLDGMRPTRQALADKGIRTGLYARFRAAMADKIEKARETRSQDFRNIVFNSRYTNHRIQLTAPRDVILQDGTKVKGRPLVAQFKDSTYRIPRHIEEEDAKVIIAKLRAHPAYGIGKDFWEQADALDEGKLHKMAEVAQLLESDPDVKNGVLDFITAQEFEVAASREHPAEKAGREMTERKERERIEREAEAERERLEEEEAESEEDEDLVDPPADEEEEPAPAPAPPKPKRKPKKGKARKPRTRGAVSPPA